MYKFIILFLSVLLLASCSKPVTIYTIDVSDITNLKSSPYRNQTIKIAYPKSIKDMMSRDITIKYEANKQSFYQNSIWAENINRLVMAYITEILENAQIFKTTINYSSYVSSDYLLEIFIHQMHHRINANSSEAVVSIKLNLLDSQSRKLLKTKRFDYRIATTNQDAQGYIEANQKAFNAFRNDMIEWIVR